MENAGRGATDVLVRELPPAGRGGPVVVVCGTGNNGGDGLVVARQLRVRGLRVVVALAGDAQRMSPDARANLDAWRGVGGDVTELRPGAPLGALAEAMAGAAVVVDGLFGTGLDRPIEGWLAGVVSAMNASPAPRLALDLPSGLDADTGATLGVAVEAHLTVTFAFPKLGLVTPGGARLAGRLHVVDIGVPAALAAHVGDAAQLIEASDAARWLGARAPGAHKNAAGHVLVVGGSRGKVGAPQLVARGALRAGAGLVTIATWPDVARIEPARVAQGLDPLLEAARAVVVGPGLGLGEDARAAVEHVLAARAGATVIDADALTMAAGRLDVLRAAKDAIVTPHPGEAARLLGKTSAAVEADRFRAARDLVSATGAVVASPDGRLAVSPVACPALATAGSGDVLAGIVAAAACAQPPFEAACAGVILHGLVGQAWSRAHGGADRGMLASEIADGLTSLGGTPT
jgi:NAD(P)H-hydrate epimerase